MVRAILIRLYPHDGQQVLLLILLTHPVQSVTLVFNSHNLSNFQLIFHLLGGWKIFSHLLGGRGEVVSGDSSNPTPGHIQIFRNLEF